MGAAKALKNIALTATAQDSHNTLKYKNILKWLKSGHEVKVAITGKADRHKAIENIYKQLQKETKSAALVKQMVEKPDSIKFYLKPTPEAANLVIDEDLGHSDPDQDISEITEGKDVFSEEFEKELDESIKGETGKMKKK